MFFWSLRTNYIQYIFLCVIIFFFVLCKASAKNFLAIVIFYEASFGKEKFITSGPGFIALIVVGVITAIYVVVEFFRHNLKNNLKILIKNSIFQALLILLLVMLISLINAEAFMMSLGQIGVFSLNILFTVIAILYFENSKENRDYIAYSLVTFMVICVSQFLLNVLYTYLTNNAETFWYLLKDKKIDVGWSVGNHLTIPINMGIAASIYLFFRFSNIKSRLLMIILSIYGVVGIMMTYSRASLIGLAAIIVVFIIYAIYSKTIKLSIKTVLITLCVTVPVIIVLLWSGFLTKYLSRLFEIGFWSNGRTDLWNLAWNLFKDNWIIGTGWGTSKYYITTILNRPEYNYHNFVIQMTTCGILGIIALIYYLGVVFKNIFSIKLFNVFTIAILLQFLTHGMLDTVLFNKFFMPFLSYMIVISYKNKINEVNYIF